ncbi:NBR1-Ig-like domain-containing protein [Angustibacter aerolatus]
MAERTATERAAAIEGFAALLSRLRDDAGTPSFRAMAGRSRAVSHTTLHEAAQGNRLPSWPTTAEFVKACGADPADYRERWEQANRAVQACAGTAASGTASSGTAASDTAASDTAAAEPSSAPAPRTHDDAPDPADRPGRRRRAAVVALVAAAVVVVVALAVGVTWWAGRDDRSTGGSAAGPTSPTVCPVRQANPAPAPPRNVGDDSAFVADATLPDCTHVRRGTTVRKVWRLRNTGKLDWRGYALHRVDLPETRDQCQTIPDVRVPDTAAGKTVDVAVDVVVPMRPGFCFVRFKMLDDEGQQAFPGNRPVNFQLLVD